MSCKPQIIRKIIAEEFGLERKKVNDETPFMANHEKSYFDCVDVIYDLEHKYNVKLPESDFVKYDTVGGLVNSIVAEVKKRSK